MAFYFYALRIGPLGRGNLIFSLGVVFSLENSTPHCVFLFLRSSFSGDRLFPSIAYGAELERRFNAPLRPMGFFEKTLFSVLVLCPCVLVPLCLCAAALGFF